MENDPKFLKMVSLQEHQRHKITVLKRPQNIRKILQHSFLAPWATLIFMCTVHIMFNFKFELTLSFQNIRNSFTRKTRCFRKSGIWFIEISNFLLSIISLDRYPQKDCIRETCFKHGRSSFPLLAIAKRTGLSDLNICRFTYAFQIPF